MASQDEAKDRIEKTSKILSNAPDYLDLSQCSTLIEQANSAYDMGDYDSAVDMANQAKDNAMDIRNKYLMIVQELEGLEKRIEDFKVKGIDVEGSQELIEQIKNSLVKNDFETAVSLIASSNRRRSISTSPTQQTFITRPGKPTHKTISPEPWNAAPRPRTALYDCDRSTWML
jgi:hypothetical protein